MSNPSALRLALVAATAALATVGCSGGSNALPELIRDLAVTPPDLSVPVDLTVPPVDLAELARPDAGVQCGNMTCTPGLVCCVQIVGMTAQATCSATCDTDGGGITLECDGPGTCPGNNPCCVSIALGGGVPMSSGAKCQPGPNDCMTALDFQTLSLTTRLCKKDGDCSGTFLGQKARCCSINAAPLHFCAAPVMMGGFNVSCP